MRCAAVPRQATDVCDGVTSPSSDGASPAHVECPPSSGNREPFPTSATSADVLLDFARTCCSETDAVMPHVRDTQWDINSAQQSSCSQSTAGPPKLVDPPKLGGKKRGKHSKTCRSRKSAGGLGKLGLQSCKDASKDLPCSNPWLPNGASTPASPLHHVAVTSVIPNVCFGVDMARCRQVWRGAGVNSS